VPGGLAGLGEGEVPEKIASKYASAGWKSLLPLAIGAGVVVLLLRRR